MSERVSECVDLLAISPLVDQSFLERVLLSGQHNITAETMKEKMRERVGKKSDAETKGNRRHFGVPTTRNP